MVSFRETTQYTGTLLTDPSLSSYRALDFEKSIISLLGMKSLHEGITAFKEGYRPGTIQGDAIQLGGVLIVDPENRAHYYFRSSEAADHPAIEELLQVAAQYQA